MIGLVHGVLKVLNLLNCSCVLVYITQDQSYGGEGSQVAEASLRGGHVAEAALAVLK